MECWDLWGTAIEATIRWGYGRVVVWSRFYNVGKLSWCVDGAAYAKTSRDSGKSAKNTPYFVAK
jgi:hypothetical protein